MGCRCQAAGAGASEVPAVIVVLLGLVVSLLRRRSEVEEH
jgi:MYXO-CTERM domain-containing protein